jgi:Na+/H+ antiporter NhaC
MSSAGAECEHINHVSTQIPYAVFVAAISFVCFVVAGFVPVWYVMLPLSIGVMIGVLFLTKFIVNKFDKKATATAEVTAEENDGKAE